MKKKCLFLTEANIAHDGRTVELIDVMKEVCDTTVFCFDYDAENKSNIIHKVKKSKGPLRRIRSTLRLTRAAAASLHEILFVDNSKACVDAFLLLLRNRKPIIILDTRELYLKGEQRSRLMRIICWFERRIIRRADYIIAANESRARYMKDYYHLNIDPVIFENIRKITVNPQEIEKLEEFIQSGDKILSYTGGLMKNREVPIIEALKKLEYNFKLVIAGRCTEDEYKTFAQAIKADNIEKRILYLAELSRGQLRYLIQKSYIGFVYYEGKTVNEKYCASGKIYEYMFEGVPFASPMLASHVDMEKKYGVCACDNNLSLAVRRIDKNYNRYQEKVAAYMENISEEMNRNNLAMSIRDFVYHNSANGEQV